MAQEQLSPRAAVGVGLLFIALGMLPACGALGIVPLRLTPGTPVWVGVCSGMIFVLGGAAVINGYAFGGGAHFNAKSTRLVRTLQHGLGFALCAMFVAVFGWVAFGPGERQFSSTISLPFWRQSGRGSEWIGRAMFAVGALMGVALALFAGASIFRPRR